MILDGEVLKRGGEAGGKRIIEGGDFAHEDIERPAVGDNVMKTESEEVAVMRQAKEACGE